MGGGGNFDIFTPEIIKVASIDVQLKLPILRHFEIKNETPGETNSSRVYTQPSCTYPTISSLCVVSIFISIFITVPQAEVYYRSLAKIRGPQAEVSDV